MHVTVAEPANVRVESAGTPPPPRPAQYPTNAHRWTDLGLVLLVGFGYSIAGSVYVAFVHQPSVYSNLRVLAGIFQELTALALFGVLFNRQGRKLRTLGLDFRWTDIPKGLGLVIGCFTVMGIANFGIGILWSLIGHNTPHFNDTSSRFTATSIWLLFPFLLLNPFFEEILVRGYLMTELIELRYSVAAAAFVSLALQTSYHLYYGLFGALVVGSGLSVLALYYALSRRVTPVIVAHVLWDLTALLSAWHR